MSTTENPIRILSDFTEEVKTYVVSSGGRLLDSVSERPTGGAVATDLNTDAKLVYVENDASNATALVSFLSETLVAISDRVFCPAGAGVCMPIPDGSAIVLVSVDTSDTGIVGIKTS